MPCEDAKIDINRRIEGVQPLQLQQEENCPEEMEDNETDDNETDDEEFDDYFSSDETMESNGPNETNIINWVNDIVMEVREVVCSRDDGDRDNLMENKKFAKYFINLCYMLPVWSGICCKLFNSPNLIGSSWSSETNFKNTRQLHGDQIPCSADQFVKRDLELNNSTVIDASKKYGTKNKPRNQSKSQKKSVSSNQERGKRASSSRTNENDESHLSDEKENAEPNINVACPVCANGSAPDPNGAHKCISCNKPVHALAECSLPIGEEEGYGELRQCISCHRSETNKRTDQSEIAEALNCEEQWERKISSTQSKYLKKQSNWSLVAVNKKSTIPLLLNGNSSKTVYTFDKKKVVLSNTCAIDAVIQLIAGAYAYHPAYRLNITNRTGIFQIATMLATQ